MTLPNPAFPNIRQDPGIRFGNPRVLPSHMETWVLAAAVLAGNETCERCAWWYEVTVAEVEEAVRFEGCLLMQRTQYERAFA